MKNSVHRLEINSGDDVFNSIYPKEIQELALKHFTPVEVAKKAAEYLASIPKAKILDIGSGAGKFCLVGASCTNGIFTGVEQRENLVALSKELAISNNIPNAHFIHSNITEIDFSEYDAFYFYNSFHENIDESAKMDSTILTAQKYFGMYSDYVSFSLSQLKKGTRLVTYWSPLHEVPSEYEVQFTAFEDRLKFWEKVK